MLSGDLFATVELEFVDREHLGVLRSVFAANGWAVEPSQADAPETVVRLHRVLRDRLDTVDARMIERDLRSMVGGVPCRLLRCSVSLAEAAPLEAPEWTSSTLRWDGGRLLRTEATARYRAESADPPGAGAAGASADPGTEAVPRSVEERPRFVVAKLALCALSTVAFALLPTQFLPTEVVRGIDVVVPLLAVLVILVAVLAWSGTQWVLRRSLGRLRRRRAEIEGGSELAQQAAVGAILGLGIGEVYAYYSQNPAGVPDLFLVAVTVLLLVAVSAATAGVSIAVRVFRTRAPGFALGAALLVALAAGVIRLPSWAYFSGMGVSMFSADLDWPSTVVLAVPFFVAVAASAVILAVAWIVRRYIRSRGMRMALRAACVGGVVVSLVSSLAGSFVDGRNFLSTTTTAAQWAGYPHPVCIDDEAADGRPYWLIVSAGATVVLVRRHVPGRIDPVAVVVEQRALGTATMRFTGEFDGCSEP